MKVNLNSKINSKLKSFANKKAKEYKLEQIDPMLFAGIKEFILRDGKRVRPTFFLLSYLGYSRNKRLPRDLVETSIAFELLHDFLLVHDDIIDNSDTRRGKPTLHRIFQRGLNESEKIGQDLSIVAGDIIYAMAIDAFLSFNAPLKVTKVVLKSFLKSTILTGAGEFIDIKNGLISINKIKEKQIRLNYLLKTAEYTFMSPLFCGCMFAGEKFSEAKKIEKYGQYLGEAFQIQDDLIGIFEKSKVIGKSVLSDIMEAKKTLPIFWAYQNSSKLEKKFIETCLGNKNLCYADLQKIRKIIKETGAYAATKQEIQKLLTKAEQVLERTSMSRSYKQLFRKYVKSYIKL
ncbi:MAG: polyprenyl synthetase family protein [Candidatus Omnitrophota bacterium]